MPLLRVYKGTCYVPPSLAQRRTVRELNPTKLIFRDDFLNSPKDGTHTRQVHGCRTPSARSRHPLKTPEPEYQLRCQTAITRPPENPEGLLLSPVLSPAARPWPGQEPALSVCGQAVSNQAQRRFSRERTIFQRMMPERRDRHVPKQTKTSSLHAPHKEMNLKWTVDVNVKPNLKF